MVYLKNSLGNAGRVDQIDADTAESDNGILANNVRYSEFVIIHYYIHHMKRRSTYESEFFAIYNLVDTEAKHA